MSNLSKLWIVAGVAAILVAAAGLATAGHPESGVDAKAAFERLKGMAGTWQGQPTAEKGELPEGESMPDSVTHEFEVSANGSVVMETMNPGTDHEMINMYHLDGDELVMTHYCAGGNQPTMRLDRSKAKAHDLPFEFTGGTNLDPAADDHIHGGRMVFLEDGRVESWWTGYSGGKEAATLKFTLKRTE